MYVCEREIGGGYSVTLRGKDVDSEQEEGG